MASGTSLGATRFGRWGLFVGLLASLACDRVTPRDRAIAAENAAAEQADEQARLEAEEQEQKDLAIAAIEDDRGEPPRPLDEDEFDGVLAYYCGECHGAGEGSLDSNLTLPFETLEDLLDLKKVTPGDSAASRVMVRIRAEDMPPVQVDLPPVPPATVQLLADFIDGLPQESGD
jgi:hypothetical protein